MVPSPTSHNGATNGHRADVDIDMLYSFWPGTPPAPQPLPEAAFSLTLKGTLDGHEALLTARGQTAAEFKAKLVAIRGLLDAKPQPAPQAAREPQGQGMDWCSLHNVKLHLNHGKDGRTWLSHKAPDGQWCKGK
jgi:hypothetical protein